jgi:hypothetical protein
MRRPPSVASSSFEAAPLQAAATGRVVNRRAPAGEAPLLSSSLSPYKGWILQDADLALFRNWLLPALGSGCVLDVL